MPELKEALRSSTKRSSPGHDGVIYRVIRNLHGAQQELLIEALNAIWHSSTLPAQWPLSLIAPILKAGKPANAIASYRPIALTSALGKTLEAFARKRLEWIARISGTFREQRTGFSAPRATAGSLADVISTLEKAKHRGELAFLVLLDVEKAFDSLPHYCIR